MTEFWDEAKAEEFKRLGPMLNELVGGIECERSAFAEG
jgi:hypothetical protein